jgi:thiol-disulfide isomerase/thioredoxin
MMIKIIVITIFISLISQIKQYADIQSNITKEQQHYFLLNKQVPHFTGYRLDGSTVDETFLKNKVILLNFMFIGCSGCMQELPDLAKLNKEYDFKDFMIVTIMGNGIEDIKSYQGTGDTSKVFYQIRKMFKSEKITNPIIAECKEVQQNGAIGAIRTCTNNISKVFRIGAYPTNLLIDSKGVIIKQYHNLSDEERYNDLKIQLSHLIK